MTEQNSTDLFERYSRAEISAVRLRRELGGITYGDVLIQMARRDLPLPRTPEPGSRERIARARALLFPRAP